MVLGTAPTARPLIAHGFPQHFGSSPMFRRSCLPGGAASPGAGGDVAVVLVHGYLCMSRAVHWQGLLPLRRELLAAGHPVFRSCVPRTGPVALRAARLARFLDTLPQRRLILV